MKKVLRAYKKTVSIVNETAIWMYENLGSDRIGFLMESNEKESGKYTFMGVDPQALVQSEKDGLVITENNGNVTKLKGNPLVLLKEYFSSFEVHSDETQDEFNGGLVGSLGYDFIRYTENLPDDNEDEIGIETIQLMLALKFIAIDHMAETVTAVVLDEDNEEGKKRALAEAEKLIDEARTPGNENKKSCEIKNHHDGVIIKKSDTLEQYSEKVNKIKATNKSYHDFSKVSGAILYLDPPYEGSNQKGYINSFDSQEFYDRAFEMAKNNIVIISSYSISDERFESVYSFDEARSTLQGGENSKAKNEKLFMVKNS